MSSKKALLYAFTIGAACVFCTWFFGHLWVFVILIIATVTGIILSTSGGNKKSDTDSDR